MVDKCDRSTARPRQPNTSDKKYFEKFRSLIMYNGLSDVTED